jgi:hypothetical protein
VSQHDAIIVADDKSPKALDLLHLVDDLVHGVDRVLHGVVSASRRRREAAPTRYVALRDDDVTYCSHGVLRGVAYDDDVTSAGFECRGQQRGRVCRRGLAAMLKLLPNPNPRPTPL